MSEGIIAPQINIADVGAFGGVDPGWAIIGDCLHVYGFEPNKEECKRLMAVTLSGQLVSLTKP